MKRWLCTPVMSWPRITGSIFLRANSIGRKKLAASMVLHPSERGMSNSTYGREIFTSSCLLLRW